MSSNETSDKKTATAGARFLRRLLEDDPLSEAQIAEVKRRCAESIHDENRKQILAILTPQHRIDDSVFCTQIDKALDAPGATFGSVADMVVQEVERREAETLAKWREHESRQRDIMDACIEMRRQTLESEGYDLTGSIYDRETGDLRRRL